MAITVFGFRSTVNEGSVQQARLKDFIKALEGLIQALKRPNKALKGFIECLQDPIKDLLKALKNPIKGF